MSKLPGVVVVSFLALAACQPDQQDVEDVCTQVVKDGLATCTQDAWGLCSKAYEDIMADLQKQNDDLKEQIRQLSTQVENGCNSYVEGYLSDYMHGHHCNWEPQADMGVGRWVCSLSASPFCQPYDPANP